MSEATSAINVTAPCPGWLDACPQAPGLADTAARAALEWARAASAWARPPLIVDIALSDDGALRVLNRTWRGKDSPTNVLAFPVADPSDVRPPGAPLLLGDVMLAFETVAREAGDQDKPLADHLRHLVVHGVLHLLGYDHEAPGEAARMEAGEIAILAGLGVPDPYRDII